MTRLVQVIVLVEDLDGSARRLDSLGLRWARGGRHPGRGTENLIVPLGDQYLELLSVVDEAEAAGSPDGRPVLEALRTRGPGLARWSVEADDLDAVASRLGLAVEDRRRVRPDEVVVRWRAIGVNEAWAEPWRCAFMSWLDPDTHPAQVTSPHPSGADRFAELEVGVADQGALEAWLGGPLPDGVRAVAGDTVGPLYLSITTPHGPIPIGPEIAR